MAHNKHGRARNVTKTKKIRANAKLLKHLLREVTSFLSASNSKPDQPAAEEICQAHGPGWSKSSKGLTERKKACLEGRIHK